MSSHLHPATIDEISHSDDLIAVDDFAEELKRLAAANEELLGGEHPAAFDPADELALLRDENETLRARVAELEEFASAAPPVQGEWAERQKEYETLLEDKSELIRTLHLRVQDLLEASQNCPDPQNEAKAPGSGDTHPVSDELDERRRQLEEDEASLMAQMRQMELALSRDRAALARQRGEVTRLQAEVNREIEQAARDPILRERLQNMRVRKDAANQPAAPVKTSDDTPIEHPQQSSGFIRRLFGK